MQNLERVVMRILIVDDDRESQRRLTRGFDRTSKEFTIEFQSDVVVTVIDAQEQLASQWYHGISFDQRLPESREGSVHSEHGMALVRGTSHERRMSFAAVYTNYPGGMHGHVAGKEQLEYIAKSSSNDGFTPEGYPRKTVPGYTRWFLDELVWEYPMKVLNQARDSTLFDWGPEIDAMIRTFGNVRKAPTDEEVTNLFQKLNYLRAEINRVFHKLLSIFVTKAGAKNPYIPDRADPIDVEKSLNIQWGLLKDTQYYCELRTALGAKEHESLADYYISHSERLRRLRNRVEHGGKVSITPDDFKSNFASVVRLLDVLRFIVSIRLVYQPHNFRSGLLSFKDMSVRGRSPATEVFYDHELEDEKDANSVYIQVLNQSPIVDAGDALKCTRDSKGRPVLEVSG